jgi:Ca2+-binding EF-hand superfamily protein
VQYFIKACDSNGNGRIERDELAELYKKMMKHRP